MPAAARFGTQTIDIVMEAFESVLKRLGNFDAKGRGAFEAYLQKAVFNRGRSILRAANRRPVPQQLSEELRDQSPSPLDLAIGNATSEAYQAACNRLPERWRLAVKLHVELGYTSKEIAVEMGLTTAHAAHELVKRALLRLAREMGNGNGETQE